MADWWADKKVARMAALTVVLMVALMAALMAGQWVCSKWKHHLMKLSFLGMSYIHLIPPHYLPKLM